jgi:hypothetical protein
MGSPPDPRRPARRSLSAATVLFVSVPLVLLPLPRPLRLLGIAGAGACVLLALLPGRAHRVPATPLALRRATRTAQVDPWPYFVIAAGCWTVCLVYLVVGLVSLTRGR